MQIDTSMGSFTVELYYKHAPRTVKNFVELSKRGYYDGTKVRAQQHLFVAGCCSSKTHGIGVWEVTIAAAVQWHMFDEPISLH